MRHLLAHTAGYSMTSAKVISRAGYPSDLLQPRVPVLAEALERASGIEFDAYLAEAVFEPLGMADTVLDGGAPRRPASGRRRRSPTLWLRRRPAAARDGVRADARRGHRPCSSPGCTGCCPVSVCNGRTTGAWGSRSGAASPRTGRARRTRPRTYGHFGQSGTFLWVDPVADLALVVLTDRKFEEWAYPLWPALSDEVLREFGAD